jgi:hypothetical protein
MLPPPLLTLPIHEQLQAAKRVGAVSCNCSLDLGISVVTVGLESDGWFYNNRKFPFLDRCKERTIYYWAGSSFEVVSRFTEALIKLVPTEWGPPTFEIDGIKMLPTAKVSPLADAERKVALVKPRAKRILDTCGGLGYFARAAIQQGAGVIYSFEKNPDVLWIRSLNAWSPDSAWASTPPSALQVTLGDVTEHIQSLANASVDVVLHDPPRFGIAGELYSQAFYQQLARVLVYRGQLFHYTGTPNQLTSGRDVPAEVAKRLKHAGFATQFNGDGILATKISRF